MKQDIYQKVKAVQKNTQLKEVFRFDDDSVIGWNSFLELGKNSSFPYGVVFTNKNITINY